MTAYRMLIPVSIITNVSFEPVPDYDGSDTGLVRLEFDSAIAGQGWVMLPKDIFSDGFLGRIDWPMALSTKHKANLGKDLADDH